ncbi:hypothetical protein Saso_16520 [Streptomyces asoensis]|uniref:Uncharacterized protein n=1 Tax=Streptomyces asoensis TaxID=249586 RepID=A0ABQ3RW50_9ACTN|nr:hypothetical protein Saso_16520 [Streptomyces asoensis]
MSRRNARPADGSGHHGAEHGVTPRDTAEHGRTQRGTARCGEARQDTVRQRGHRGEGTAAHGGRPSLRRQPVPHVAPLSVKAPGAALFPVWVA